ncbi:MAG TPA: phosphatase PAP2 family protein [Xanthobacteraceae bacterium]|nr:phosphatase PAP2 family protein [Xanthobacteraceae bacterium]
MSNSSAAARRVTAWLIALAVTIAVVAACYAWLDRPIAFFAHDELRNAALFAELPKTSEWFAALALIIVAVLGLRGLTGRPLSKPESVALLCALSLMAAAAVKSYLKFAFGRTWPETWIDNNASLMRDGVYGFNFFHGGRGYEAFPSGHTAAAFAVVTVLWMCYPRWRPLYSLIAAAVVVGLVGANFHFLSDIIAGAFIGASAGWIAVLMWQAGGADVTGDARRAIDDRGGKARG